MIKKNLCTFHINGGSPHYHCPSFFLLFIHCFLHLGIDLVCEVGIDFRRRYNTSNYKIHFLLNMVKIHIYNIFFQVHIRQTRIFKYNLLFNSMTKPISCVKIQTIKKF